MNKTSKQKLHLNCKKKQILLKHKGPSILTDRHLEKTQNKKQVVSAGKYISQLNTAGLSGACGSRDETLEMELR